MCIFGYTVCMADIPLHISLPTSQELSQEKAWIESACEEIGLETINTLAQRALENRAKSYSPYSTYKVGVALLSTSGKIYDGANVERASYSETDHAEESAVTAAVLGGEMQTEGRKFIKAVAVCHAGKSAPCGRCRQIIVEHCDNAVVILVDTEGKIHTITSMSTILPQAFTPTELGM